MEKLVPLYALDWNPVSDNELTPTDLLPPTCTKSGLTAPPGPDPTLEKCERPPTGTSSSDSQT